MKYKALKVLRNAEHKVIAQIGDVFDDKLITDKSAIEKLIEVKAIEKIEDKTSLPSQGGK